MSDVGIDFICEICALMQRYGFIATQAQFSVQMLGKQPSYLSCMKARSLTPSAAVLNVLSGRIMQRVQLFEQNRHLGKDYAPVLNASYQRLKTIQNMIDSQLDNGVSIDVVGMSRLQDGFGSTELTVSARALGQSIVPLLNAGVGHPKRGGL